MKNFPLLMILFLPLIIIFVDKKIFKHSPVQKPINFPPNKTTFWGKKNAGKKINEIIIIPEKKKNENIKFLIIIIKSYIKSLYFCLFLITFIFVPLINISAGFNLTL